MSKNRIFTLIALAGLAPVASADIVNVDGKAAIFDAGRDAPLLDGELPPVLDVPANAVFVTLPEVTGLVRAHPVLQWGGPDGNSTTINDTDINSFEGISGLLHPMTMSLVGVFLTDELPGEGDAPARLDFHSIGSSFETIAPEIGQTFFMGDGLGVDDAVQQFVVPEGATRLFLGFADGEYFTGDPGAYHDNEGAFDANVQFHLVPSPGALALLGLGGLATARRKR